MNLPPVCAKATTAPRVHHHWTPDELHVKEGLSPDTLALLKQRGHNIAVKPSMGRTQTIQLRAGRCIGAQIRGIRMGRSWGIDAWVGLTDKPPTNNDRRAPYKARPFN